MEYTREDVIIWHDDARLRKGVKCYLSTDPEILLSGVTNGKLEELTFVETAYDPDFGWIFYAKNNKGFSYTAKYIILKKEPEKKLVPFNFSLKEDRDAVIGKRVFHKTLGFDGYICEFMKYKDGWQAQGMSASDLLINGIFVNTGKPVGKEVEE